MTNYMVLSMQFSTEEYFEVPKMLHEDWGFDPKDISNKKIMIIGTKNDTPSHYPMHNGWEMLMRSK